MKIVGITGPLGAGKDTVAQFALEWAEQRGLSAARFAFADQLKVSAARALGFEGDAEECVAFCNDLKQAGSQVLVISGGQTEPPYHADIKKRITGREYLQFFGTEAHRDVFSQDFWVEQARAQLDSLRAAGTEVVFITDVRFSNEGKMILKDGGEIWNVDRPYQNRPHAGGHPSEKGLPDGQIEFDIHNDGTLADLEQLVHDIADCNIAGCVSEPIK